MDSILTVCEARNNVPESLRKVVQSIEQCSGRANRHQLIAGLLYVLMQECGYILVESTDVSQSDDDVTLAGCEKRTMTFNLQRLLAQSSLVSPLLAPSSGSYKLPLQLVGVDNYRFHLLMTPSAEDLMVVNLLITGEDYKDCYSIALRMSSYAPKPEANNISDRFYDLPKLSLTFKDSIAHKGRSAVLNEEGLVNNSLVGLLPEIKCKIARHLPLKDIFHLSVTCRSMHAIINDISIWKMLIWRDLSIKTSETQSENVDNLKKLYKNKWAPPRVTLSVDNSSFLYDGLDFDSETDTDGTDDSFSVSHRSSFDFRPYYILKRDT